ncbi:MAG: homoserine O-succinyltransferase [Chitinivibrionales bacterium]|nr:homoserine O-succinyltransferase [Chitinivibrionales bacterium]
MPIKIPKNLPAASILSHENVFIMDQERAEHQDIRELKILILNLMPTKIETETQLLRLLSNSALQVEIELLKLKSYKPKNTPEEHLLTFYKSFDQISEKKFDGMIITGAPVEQMEFTEVKYWKELTEIMDWSVANVTSILYICWGAQAGLFHHFGVKKHPNKNNKKYSGVFRHRIVKKHNVLLRGFDDYFFVPHSRYTEVLRHEIETVAQLDVLVESEISGVHLVATRDLKHIFVTGHAEYDPLTLKNEYERDIANGLSTEIPDNYFEDDDPAKAPLVTWRSHANLLFSNWLNYAVYQITDYGMPFAATKKKHEVLNLAIFGIGSVGGTLIKQILKSRYKIIEQDDLLLNIYAIANSKRMHLEKSGIQYDWQQNIAVTMKVNSLEDLFDYTRSNELHNTIFLDISASQELANRYPEIIQNGFNIVTANKKPNAGTYMLYKAIRSSLAKNQKFYLYETTVGASLPLIETVKFLVKSGDTINRIIGVFSGSLSYLFNEYSKRPEPFSHLLKQAVSLGLTEPDPRDDLSGVDVARKLLILAREIGSDAEFEDIDLQPLIGRELIDLPISQFWERKERLDACFQQIRSNQETDHVLRYVGELTKKTLSVRLISVPKSSTLGNLSAADAIFEIHTQRYKDNPLVIQGAGAGAELTASGLLSDILRIGQYLKYKNS